MQRFNRSTSLFKLWKKETLHWVRVVVSWDTCTVPVAHPVKVWRIFNRLSARKSGCVRTHSCVRVCVYGASLVSLVPFCCLEAPCSLPSESRTCSVPLSPAAVTWFPSRQRRSTGPSAPTVYSHDTSGKSKVYPVASRARVRRKSMMERGLSAERRGETVRRVSVWAPFALRAAPRVRINSL